MKILVRKSVTEVEAIAKRFCTMGIVPEKRTGQVFFLSNKGYNINTVNIIYTFNTCQIQNGGKDIDTGN